MSAPNPHVHHAHGELHNVDTAHEESDINVRAIVGFIVVLTVITLLLQGAMYGFFFLFDKIEEKGDPAVSPVSRQTPAGPADFPQPILQTTPWTDLRKLRADESSYLHSYGWVDKQAGVARVPIDKAKALLLQRGVPVRPELADPAEGTRIAVTGESSGGRNLAAGGADKSTVPAAGGAKGAEGATGANGPVPTAPAGATPSKKPGGGL